MPAQDREPVILGLQGQLCVLLLNKTQVLHNHLSVLNAHMLTLLVHNLNREMRQDLLGPLNPMSLAEKRNKCIVNSRTFPNSSHLDLKVSVGPKLTYKVIQESSPNLRA